VLADGGTGSWRIAVTVPHAVQLLATYSYIGKVFPHHTNDERGGMVLISQKLGVWRHANGEAAKNI
jgi:hypothetical protein